MNESIFDLVKKQETNYQKGSIKQGKYVDFDMLETIEKINAYSHSKHVSGPNDALGRQKPFFNICTAAINVWFKATDIDRKNIKFKATKASNYIKAFIASILLRNWMRKINFGKFLNEWGRTLAKYGSAVSKFVEKDGQLIATVVAWDRMICDPINFTDNIKIEKLWYTPAQLRRMPYDQKLIKEIIDDATESRETASGEKKDLRDDYIPLYEVHGELPLSYLTDKEKDDDTYRQQMHVLYLNGKGETSLYKGKEKKDPYMITHLIEEDGRTLSIGAVEHLFNAQWMVNHSVKQIKDQLDLASKMVLQTADKDFVGKNVLDEIETGDILTYAEGKPLTQVNNQSHDTPAISDYLERWKGIAREITGTPEAMTGETMPSGTPYSQTALLNQEAHTLFDLMTENKGLSLEDMLREHIIPFFKKSLNNKDEIAVVLDGEEIDQLDELDLPDKLEQELKRRVLNEEEVPPVEQMEQEIKAKNSKFGYTRFLSTVKQTWAEWISDLEDSIEVEITNENNDKRTALTSLNTVLQTIAGNPQILADPNGRMVFNMILSEIGLINPIQLRKTETQSAAPIGGGVGAPQINPNQPIQ